MRSGLPAIISVLLTGAPAVCAPVEWSDVFGFSPLIEYARDVAVDDAGNVYVTGIAAHRVGVYDYATIKYDNAGNRQWVRRYNNPFDHNDRAGRIGLDAAGNVYVGGISWGGGNTGQGPKFDVYIIKYDPDGNTIWSHRFNSPWDNDDYMDDMAVMPDGAVYFTGTSYYPVGVATDAEYTVVRVNPDGSFGWLRNVDGPQGDIGWISARLQADTSGVYFCGTVARPASDGGTHGMYSAVKFGHDGTKLWGTIWDPPEQDVSGTEYTLVHDSTLDPSGNFIIAGRYNDSRHGDTVEGDALLLKFEPDGDLAWAQTRSTPTTEAFDRVTTDAQGRIYATGAFNVDTNSLIHADYMTAAYDANGAPLWEHTDAGDAVLYDGDGFVEVASDGRVIVGARFQDNATGEDMRIYVYDPLDGTILDTAVYDNSYSDYIFGMALDPYDNAILVGRTTPNDDAQFAVAKVATGHAPPPTCDADLDADGDADVFDLLAYLDAWFGLDPAADLTGDPAVDVFDLLAYLDVWFTGC